MTQTNQNKDYSWLKAQILQNIQEIGTQWGYTAEDATDNIVELIDEHYIGKGEAKPPISGELESVEEFAPDDDPTCASCGFGEWRHTNTHPCAKYVPRKGTRLYTESEVEQRCIEARKDQIEVDFLAYNVNLDVDESELIAIRDDLQKQLSTNNKDTLERSSDDKS